MTRLLLAFAAIPLVLSLAACGSSGGSDTSGPSDTGAQITFAQAGAGMLKVTQGWVSAPEGSSSMPGMDDSSMPGMDMSDMTQMAGSAAYATITSTGAADRLVSVTSPQVDSVTLHRTVDRGGAGTMVMAHSILIPAHGTTKLAPGGTHLMLTGLSDTLGVGSSLPLTLHFRSGTTITATFPVIDPSDRPEQ